MIIKIKKQKGYGLIEMVVGLALAGILTTGITTFTVQTITEGARSNNCMQAICQLENAGYWMGRDVQMAENITLGQSAGFPLQLVWIDSDQNEYQVTFNISGGQINRSLIKNGENPIQTLIAQSINPAPSLTNLSYAGGLLTFNVTSTFRNNNVSRSYQIKKRLDIQE
jgi:prepilin-type N-terminal cleavage/methylation domain-containing protein